MSDEILVTGAAGFVGQHLVTRFAEQDHAVTALDIVQQPPESYRDLVGNGVKYISGSILNEAFVRTEVFPYPDAFDRVFHLAAVVGVDRYIDPDDPLYLVDVNINGTKILLDRLRGSRSRVIYASTSEIYGRNPDVPWSEEDDRVVGPPTRHRWSYSAMKSVCEHMVHMVGETEPSVSTTVVRPFNLYGPYQRPSFVIPKFVQMALNGDPPTVHGDGTQKRCFTYIEDFIEGLVQASNRRAGLNETYNFGGTSEVEIRRVAELVLDAVGRDDLDPVHVDREEDTGRNFEDPDRRIPDIERARKKLGWQPRTSLEEGINEMAREMEQRMA